MVPSARRKPSQIVDPDNWPEVANSVEVALNYIRRQPGELHVEVRFMIDNDVGLGGTADTVAVNERRSSSSTSSTARRRSPYRDNDQLRPTRSAPASGSVASALPPRDHSAARPPGERRHRMARLSDANLTRFESRLRLAARQTLKESAPRRAGAWCRWCPARMTCAEYQVRQAKEASL